MVIGITGGIGSGKSFVADCFLKFDNTLYLHADEEAKKLMNSSSEIKEKLIALFGDESYVNDKLNRPYISNIVFSNPEKLKELNSIVHPVVRKHFAEFIEKNTQDHLIIYENAILFEIQSDLICDCIIAVTAPIDIKIQRVIERDNISSEEVRKRMSQQWPDSKKLLLSNYRILNINKEETMLKVRDIHNILTKKQSMI